MLDREQVSYDFDQSLIWHVIFHPGKRFWSRQFSHVSLAGYSNDTWLHLDAQLGGMNAASIYHHDEVEEYLKFLLANYTVVRFGPARAIPSRAFFTPLTCVSFVKHVIRPPSSALRPDGLFRDLMRIEGVKVMNETETTSGDG